MHSEAQLPRPRRARMLAGQAFQSRGTIKALSREKDTTVRACKDLAGLISQSIQASDKPIPTAA